jgi:small subunit ribosomal protein S21
MLRIDVELGNIEKALKKYKTKFNKTKQLNLIKENRYYIKPTTKNRLKKIKAIRVNNWNKSIE